MRLELSPAVRFQEVEGEAVLLDIERGEYFGLNEVGTRFWVRAREDRDIGAIIDALLDEYEVEPKDELIQLPAILK